ncbi:hypothetical protein GCM10010232_01570 [Streptomyces amakusaensis]|uniref:DUF5707 domain-containing protein n=1 Tax=Streptomyces amakusaensis TaxID=67271 RepID=A0ABW0AVS4_9ACTN
MRFRVSAAVVTGAIALTGLSAPAVQADEKPAGFSKAFAAKPQDDISTGDTKITDIVLNGGKPLALGTAKKTFTLTFKASDSSGIESASGLLWRGKDFTSAKEGIRPDHDEVKCKGGTKATCTVTFTLDPRAEDATNSFAGGGWHLAVSALGKDRSVRAIFKARTTSLHRASQISVNASPEDVKKGKTLTVTGSLSRADWEAKKYTGYGKQSVKLQFRKKGAKTFTTVKTVKTDAKGKLKTTVKATVDGTYRYAFDGTSTTAPVTNGGDFIDVR